eukprot:gnl/TRDRNA2_/TRDRNA2_80790_c0_seq2.p1 gnl/TRDRNA2_/TRDRNA2_80790_c0~~gnl/TRDRNA2_/TRDRNA2_80790_c0_seq2.p1  ORF type:complete len:581 (-),score=141.29 gnl/TRDRNA2_/TRDRNA2_80790_c0_seq2:132-1874(-)
MAGSGKEPVITKVNDMDDVRAALAAKGYDIVEQDEEKDASDSDDNLMPGRLPSLEPELAKTKGNEAFKKEKYDKAIRCWQGGLKSILSALCAGPEALSNQRLSELDLTLNLNIAMAYTRKGDYDAAVRSADKALVRREALAPNLVVKALYRKANAQRSLKRLSECLETLKDLLEVEPDNKAGLQMHQEVDREWKQQCQAQKSRMKKLFSQMEGEDKRIQEEKRMARARLREGCGIRWLPEVDVDAEKYERDEARKCDGQDWAAALSRSAIWVAEEFAVEGTPCFKPDTEKVRLWFLGVSSTCELRMISPSYFMARMPGVVELEIVLVGFLGELDPDNKRVPDPKADKLPQGLLESKYDEGARKVTVRLIKGTLQEALDAGLGTDPNPPVYPGAHRSCEPAPPAAAAGADLEAVKEGSNGAQSGPCAAATDEAGAEVAAASGEQQPTADATTSAASGADVQQVSQELMLPNLCYLAHPQLHRYFTEFHPAVSWLIEHKVPTAIIGASEPDLSWKQDEALLKALGCDIVIGKRESPYPMCLPDNPDVRKCNHIIGFVGGKAVPKDKLTKVKLDLLGQDYTVR